MPHEIPWDWPPCRDKYRFTSLEVGKTYIYTPEEMDTTVEHFRHYLQRWARQHDYLARTHVTPEGIVVILSDRKDDDETSSE